MKILRIIARLNIGGPTRNAVLLTANLDSLRATSKYETVLVCGEVGKDEGDMMYLARERDIEPIIVPELGRELSLVNDWRAFWKIYRIICREMPDIVHTHTAKAGAIGRTASLLYNFTQRCRVKGRGCKIVHTFHGHVLHGYFGKVKTLFFIWVERFLAVFTCKIITVSEALKKELVEKYRIASERKFSVVELGFELEELLKLPAKEEHRVVNIGIAGRLVPVKNHRMLLRIAKRIKGGGLRAKFIIIGDGELRQELEYCAKDLDIEDVVEFKGWVRDLVEIYKNLDIAVLTSLNEGTPVSIIEAMAAARPVIATNVGGVADIVEDGKSGYLVESGNEEVFLEKLLDLINDSAKRRMFGEHGRGLVKDRFSKDRLIKDMEGLYNDLVNKR